MAHTDTETITTRRRGSLHPGRRPAGGQGVESRDAQSSSSALTLKHELPRLPLPDDLIDWMGFLRRHWLLMLVVWVLVMTLVCVALYLWPRQYESSARFVVKNARQDLAVGPGEGAASAYREQLSETVLNTELELLRSRDIMAQVVKDLRLDRPLIEQGLAPDVARERAIGGLSGRLKTGTIRKTNVIELSYESRNPELARKVVQQVADAYLASHLAVHSSPGTYEMFQRQAIAASAELRQAEAELAALARTENLVMLETQKQEALTAIQAMEAQLNEVTANVREQTTREKIAVLHMETTPQRVPTILRDIPNQTSTEHLHTMIVDLRNKRTEALTKFQPTDRLVKELDQQIADTSAALERAETRSASEKSTGINPAWQQLDTERTKARLELSGLESKAEELRRELAGQRQRLLRIAEAGPRYDELQRNVSAAKSKYELFAKRQEEARIADVLDRQRISNVVLTETPVVSHVPSSPNVRLGVVAGAMLAGVVTIAAAFARELFIIWDRSRPRRRSTEVSILGISSTPAELRS